MFESLTEKLQGAFSKLRGRGKLSDSDIDGALREVRLALIAADVNYGIVKKFTEDVKVRAMGQEVMQSLTPGQQVVKIVNEEMVSLMGGESSGITSSVIYSPAWKKLACEPAPTNTIVCSPSFSN